MKSVHPITRTSSTLPVTAKNLKEFFYLESTNKSNPTITMKSPFDRENQQDETNSKLIVALEKLAEGFRVLLWKQTKTYGLSPIQVQILIFLKNHGTDLSKPAILAKELNVTRPTISDALNALTKKGLLETKANPTDSRSRLLSLNTKSLKLTNALEQYANPIQEALETLGLDKQSDLLHSLLKLMDELEKAEVINAQRMCFNCVFYEGNREENHHCTLLKRVLTKSQLRIDCPEHKAA